MTPPRCQAGATYGERGRIIYACPNKAEFQVIMNSEDLLIVWCEEHMRELVADMLAHNAEIHVERWRTE